MARRQIIILALQALVTTEVKGKMILQGSRQRWIFMVCGNHI